MLLERKNGDTSTLIDGIVECVEREWQMRGKIEGVTDKRIEEQMVKIEYWREKLVKGILSKWDHVQKVVIFLIWELSYRF